MQLHSGRQDMNVLLHKISGVKIWGRFFNFPPLIEFVVICHVVVGVTLSLQQWANQIETLFWDTQGIEK